MQGGPGSIPAKPTPAERTIGVRPSVETQSEAYRAGEGDISRFDQAEQPARSTIPSFSTT